MRYLEVFWNAYQGYASYLLNEVLHPHWQNYFYWLLAVSGVFFALELARPWRKEQARFRKDFWLDFFYMFFNFFLFSLVIYNAASFVIVELLNDGIVALSGFDLQKSNPLRTAPLWVVLITGFFVRDFIQWWIHRLLHYSPRLWEFHKVHHSVEEMGFAAHLRYHWMENVVYRTIEYLPLALLGIGLYDFFIIHIFTLAIGHYNHSNISVSGKITGGLLGGFIALLIAVSALDIHLLNEAGLTLQIGVVALGGLIGVFLLGPIMKIIFNSPEMHIWHHAHDMPDSHPQGINFGISLALWDYIFGTAHIPHNGRDIKLGFPGIEEFPKSFVKQNTHGFD